MSDNNDHEIYCKELSCKYGFVSQDIHNAFYWMDGFTQAAGIVLTQEQRHSLIEGVVRVANVAGTNITFWLRSVLKDIKERNKNE